MFLNTANVLDYFVCAGFVGTGATMVMDVWVLVRRRLLGIPSMSYGLVGRWLVHLTRGRFHHDSIAASPVVKHELLVGWVAHYLLGISFAALMLAIWGLDWVGQPTICPALIVGIGTVAAPFFILQPGMGAGIAASRTANPVAARIQSVITHAFFGVGLYVAGVGLATLSRLSGMF